MMDTATVHGIRCDPRYAADAAVDALLAAQHAEVLQQAVLQHWRDAHMRPQRSGGEAAAAAPRDRWARLALREHFQKHHWDDAFPIGYKCRHCGKFFGNLRTPPGRRRYAEAHAAQQALRSHEQSCLQGADDRTADVRHRAR
eukprot:gene34612-18685_t